MKRTGSSRSSTTWPPSVAEMTGVETESFSEAPSKRGNRLAVLWRENHTPSPVASLSSRDWNREPGRLMVPRVPELDSLETLRAPTEKESQF